MEKGSGGFTLVEVLVAAVILAAGMVAVLRGFSLAVNALDASQERLTVSSLLENKLAELELSAWPKRELAGAPAGRWDTPSGVFLWEARGERLMAASNAVLVRVTVEATLDRSPSRSYTAATEWLGWQGK